MSNSLADAEFLKTVAQIKDAWELGNSSDFVAGVAKLAATTAAGLGAELMLRGAFSLWRLGRAISGNSAQIEKMKGLGGVAVSEAVGQLIDLANEQHFGAWFYDQVHPETNDFFTAAQSAVMPKFDPLVLDLDGDGIETVGIDTGNPLYFDQDGDGNRTGSGWIGADDGFLVLDRNGNGAIDGGGELFGNATPLASGGPAADGFAALAGEDGNGDGQVDNLDAHWADLRVWRDLDQDGASQSGELFTLESLGIVSLGVAATAHAQTLANGNRIGKLGGYLKADGTLGQSADVDLVEDTFHSRFTAGIPITEAVQGLPDMQGSGQVRSLRESRRWRDGGWMCPEAANREWRLAA